MIEVHQDDGHGSLILSAGRGAADASLYSTVLSVVGVLGSEHVVEKAKEDFTETVPPMFIA
jgi:hypothetical protein